MEYNVESGHMPGLVPRIILAVNFDFLGKSPGPEFKFTAKENLGTKPGTCLASTLYPVNTSRLQYTALNQNCSDYSSASLPPIENCQRLSLLI